MLVSVEIEPPDAVDAVSGKQHAIIGAEQATLVHGGEIDPVGIGMKRVLDLGRTDADIVVVVGAPERMHAVGTQRHAGRGASSRAPQGGLHRHRPALDDRLVADLDVPTRQAGIAAHRAAVLLGGVVVLQHRLDHESGEIALFRVDALAQAREIVVGNLDRRFGHQLLGGALNGRDGNHEWPRFTRRRPCPAASRPAARG
jgi:hypothetical protein